MNDLYIRTEGSLEARSAKLQATEDAIAGMHETITNGNNTIATQRLQLDQARADAAESIALESAETKRRQAAEQKRDEEATERRQSQSKLDAEVELRIKTETELDRLRGRIKTIKVTPRNRQLVRRG